MSTISKFIGITVIKFQQDLFTLRNFESNGSLASEGCVKTCIENLFPRHPLIDDQDKPPQKRYLSPLSTTVMPPHAVAHYDELSCIEIETGHDPRGKLVVSRIIFSQLEQEAILDDTTRMENPIALSRQMSDEPSGSMYETLAESLVFACGGDCGQVAESTSNDDALKPRSALKRGPSLSQRNVSFKSLEIREYSMTLGDHPSAYTGPPVTLDWSHNNVEIVDLEAYENARKPRRKRKQLKLSSRTRQKLLVDNGFSITDIQLAWQSALEIRKQRYETVMQGFMSTKMEEALQSANRKFWRMFNYDC